MRIEVERGGVASEQRGDLVVENFDDPLSGLDAAEDGFTEGLFFDPGDEVLCDGELDIGLEEGEAHFAEGVRDVLLGYFPVSAKFFKGFLKVVGEIGEHGRRSGLRPR